MSFVHSLFSLEGKNAVVTGAASGLGRRCAATLAQAGAAVALLDVNAAGLAEAVAEIAALGGRTLPVAADVSDAGAVEQAVARIAEGLAPGGMLTAMVRDFLVETADGRAAAWTVPFKRFAELRELDGPLLLLASDASSYMTGSVLMVDGGLACNALQYPDS